MINGISGGVGGTASLDQLSALLMSSNDQAMKLAEKLLSVSVQQTIQDQQTGTLIDLMA